jgi:hypothetical protein
MEEFVLLVMLTQQEANVKKWASYIISLTVTHGVSAYRKITKVYVREKRAAS